MQYSDISGVYRAMARCVSVCVLVCGGVRSANASTSVMLDIVRDTCGVCVSW